MFLIPLMYLSMGHMMWNWPLPGFMADNHVAMGLAQLLLTTIVMVINQKFFISGFKGLIHKAPNMDTLVALGSTASYGYSVYALFAMTDAQMRMDMDAVMSYMHEFYFESAAMILTLITVGKMLEARSKGKTTDALKSLMKLAPKTAVLLRDGKEETVSIEQVKKGDIFIVRPGENIPVDGIVLEGNSAVNEAALTGESIPVDKAPNDTVSAATVNQSGLKREASRSRRGHNTVPDYSDGQRRGGNKSTDCKDCRPGIRCICTNGYYNRSDYDCCVAFSRSERRICSARGISVLVISCPCALGLATPVAIMVGNGMGAKNGIMFKTAVSLEETGKMEIVALDKTGTITSGEPQVTDILPANGISESELLVLAYILEKKSEHPLAKAITGRVESEVEQSEQEKLTEVSDFQAVPGNGLSGKIGGAEVLGGNLNYIGQYSEVSEEMKRQAEHLSEQGKTPLFFSQNGTFMGIIAVADVIKEDSPRAVKELQNMGIHVVMLTGDNERTAKAIGAQAGVDEVIAGVLPEGKESVIRRLKTKGKVAMVGDGINDAPALTRADMGIAIGAGTDIAIDAADVVLMKSRLSDVPAAIRMSRATLRNIHENLFWAFFYNVIGIPLAAGIWYPLFGLKLNPMFGAAAMSLSSFCVVTNALRLNLFKMYDASKDKKIKHKKESKKKQEESTMTKTMKIEGMMCGHCEARVKKTLEAIDGVKEAVVSHEAGTAVVTLEKEVADEVLKNAVEAQDYPVKGIE